MKIKKLCSALAKIIKFSVFLCIFILDGCAFFAGSPHQNFVDHLNATVGKSIDEIPPYQLPHPEDLLESKLLGNGNTENKYKYRGTCRYILEINPQSRKIVNARYEGKDEDCYVNP